MTDQGTKKLEMQFATVRVRLGQGEQEIQRPIVPGGADFSEAAVIAEARRITGLHEFGDESFLPNLRKLIASMELEADLNAYGRLFARQMLIGRLVDRLRAQELYECHPEIVERKLGPMVVVVGPARWGTTRAQSMQVHALVEEALMEADIECDPADANELDPEISDFAGVWNVRIWDPQ